MVERYDEPHEITGTEYIPLSIEQIEVATYTPNPDGSPPYTQVHVRLEVEGAGDDLPAFVLRFKSPRTLDRVIGAMLDHRNQVWPESGD